jgi:hypothetical protein
MFLLICKPWAARCKLLVVKSFTCDKIAYLLRNQSVHYFAHKCPQLVPIPNHINPSWPVSLRCILMLFSYGDWVFQIIFSLQTYWLKFCTIFLCLLCLLHVLFNWLSFVWSYLLKRPFHCVLFCGHLLTSSHSKYGILSILPLNTCDLHSSCNVGGGVGN